MSAAPSDAEAFAHWVSRLARQIPLPPVDGFPTVEETVYYRAALRAVEILWREVCSCSSLATRLLLLTTLGAQIPAAPDELAWRAAFLATRRARLAAPPPAADPRAPAPPRPAGPPAAGAPGPAAPAATPVRGLTPASAA